MLRFTFVVDKEACFAYWVQGLIRWGPYFEKQEFKFYREKGVPWTDAEERALTELRDILIKKERGFLWLWQRYAGERVKDALEAGKWKEIESVLGNKFEKVWQSETLLLRKWPTRLSRRLSQVSCSDFFGRVGSFFGITKLKSESISVKLLLYSDPNFPAGHAKMEFPSLLLLNLSNLGTEHIDSALEVLMHEATHLFEYQSSVADGLLTASYKKIIRPELPQVWTGIQKILSAVGVLKTRNSVHPNWKHLLVEAVLGSIANRRHYSYAGMSLFNRFSENNRVYRTEGSIDYLKNRNNYDLQIREVRESLVSLTKDYLDNHRRIDTEYCDFVAQRWLEVWDRYHVKVNRIGGILN